MESNLVAEFVSETGASYMEAYHYLQVKGWDLKLAIHDYILSKDEVLEISRPELVRSDSIDVIDSSCKKLTRGISRATDNINLINRARSELGLELQENGVCNINQYFIETPVFTFTLPDLSIFPDDFREFLEKDLIEMSSLLSLEQAGRLNWWAENGVCQRLWPLATTGDGNCLLHAASLGMWGFHDRLLTLRRTLHDFLSSSSYKDALWRRWRWQLTQLNAEAGLVYTEEEWHKEWDSIVSMASSTPRNSNRRRSAVTDKSKKEVSENATYESLEEIHVLALSHVLKRPIIVIADTVLKDVHGEALAPILFGGIYLPLEIPPSKCHKSPLVLTFDAAHFSALVVMEKETFADKSPHPPAVIPLTDSHHKLLPIQFSVDPGENFVWGRDENILLLNERLSLGTKEQHYLLREYLEIVYIPLSLSPLSDEVELELESDTPCDEEDIEKRFIEANEYDFEDNIPEMSESSLFGTNRSRAAKQMKSVAKQFGSIGKSMSKKLKKNLGTITKMTRSNSQKKDAASQSRLANEDLTKTQDYILSARLHTEARHEYQEEMIKNYLTNARDRFEREKRLKQKFADDEPTTIDDEKLREQAKLEGPKNCITQGCNMYGTVLTSYLCTNCYNKQRQEELSTNINSPTLSRAVIIPKKQTLSMSKNEGPGYGMGRSTFYLGASPKSYESAKTLSMTSGKSLKPVDETIRLSNSTFYNDRPQGGYYPKDWKSSYSGSGRSTLPYLMSDNQERPKTWQAEITNQIDDLGSLTLPAGFRPSDRKSSIPGTDPAHNRDERESRFSGESKKQGAKTETVWHVKRQEEQDSKYASGCELGPQDKTRSRKSPLLAGLAEDSSRSNSSQESPKGKTVRQSSQNSLDELIKETTEYYNENSEKRSEFAGRRLVDVPVDAFEVSNAKNGNVASVDEALKKKFGDQYMDRKCLNVTCIFFGSPELDNYCSMCYKGRCENLKLESGSGK